jgi:hypothetical protein
MKLRKMRLKIVSLYFMHRLHRTTDLCKYTHIGCLLVHMKIHTSENPCVCVCVCVRACMRACWTHTQVRNTAPVILGEVIYPEVDACGS